MLPKRSSKYTSWKNTLAAEIKYLFVYFVNAFAAEVVRSHVAYTFYSSTTAPAWKSKTKLPNREAKMASKMADATTTADVPTTLRSQRQQRLCVIGAGAAGLGVARRFKEPASDGSDIFHVTVFEQTDEVGGTWVYQEAIRRDHHGLPVHSSMYKNLRTNIPKECMGFLDFPFPSGGSSFPYHPDVLNYLQNYCRHFDIEPLIKFHTKVNRVRPLPGVDSMTSKSAGFEVEVEDVISKETKTYTFDAVAICNGRYSVPRYSNIEGLDTFLGERLHSHDYRKPDPFAGQVVACLGSGPSGVDIAIELASVAAKVLLCHRGAAIVSPLPANVVEMPWPDRCHPTGLEFAGDVGTVPVDALLVCTGYYYSYPFLEGEAKLYVDDSQVSPLYKHFLHTRCFPGLAVFGIPFGIVPFPVFHVQAHVFRLLLEGRLQLPVANATESDVTAAEAMEEATRVEVKTFLDDGGQHRHFHRMGIDRMTTYLDELTAWAGLHPVPRAILDCHRKSGNFRKTNLLEFHRVNYRLSGTEAVTRDGPETDPPPL